MFCCKARRNWLEHKKRACVAGAKGGGGGRKVRKRGIIREGSACYKSRGFCIPPTIFLTNPIKSTIKRDQSRVEGFSAWSELDYFVYRKLSSRDAFFMWYHNRAKYNIFVLAANATNLDNEEFLFFYCSQSTTNNDQFRVNTHDLWS